MEKRILREIVLDQRKAKMPENLIQRQIFDSVYRHVSSNQIVIVSGVRRCGKSVLLRMIQLKIEKGDYYLNFDDDRLCSFSLEDFQCLYEVFLELFGEQEHFFFDEIQNIIGWERFVRRLHDMGNTVFITGSNARMLSRELGTHLTGRFIGIKLFPFSFAEFIEYKGKSIESVERLTTIKKSLIVRLFNEWLKCGGIPEYLRLKNKEYLHFLYESVLYRDIIVRHSLTKEKQLKELVYFLASNIGKEVSFNSLRKMLGLGSAGTVSQYCSYLEDSFLFFMLKRYNVSVKKQIQYNKKVYCIDQSLAEVIGFRFSENFGRLLELVVFLKLLSLEADIFFHKEKRECDFILREGSKVISAFQVTAVLNEETKEREFAGLSEALEMYDLKQGYILTESQEFEQIIVCGGKKRLVTVLPVWKFLLK